MKTIKIRSRFYKYGLLALALFGVSACGNAPTSPSTVKFDAGYSVALDGVIAEGLILSTTNERWNIEQNISSQLMYSVGQLNGVNGVSDMARMAVNIVAVHPQDSGLYRVTYQAKLLVAWPKERDIPEGFTLIVPSRGDYQGQWDVMETLAPNPASDFACLDWGAHDVAFGNFWYYYRPDKPSCLDRVATAENRGLLVRLPMQLSLSEENTEGKRPEYAQVWADGRLVVTTIYGKAEEGATSNYDAGISAFRETYEQLVAQFGRPVESNLPAGAEPDAWHDSVKLVFATSHGPLDIHLYLVEGIRSVDQEFERAYNQRTMVSDYISYSGHSGLGANIRALARMGHFVRGQYQIYLVNGCDTFAYVDHALKKAHFLANPEAGENKYFDLITNAMPAYFHFLAESNMAIINALVDQTLTYRQILEQFDQSQRAVVTGEEDNGFPFL